MSAEAFKEKGNEFFKKGDYEKVSRERTNPAPTAMQAGQSNAASQDPAPGVRSENQRSRPAIQRMQGCSRRRSGRLVALQSEMTGRRPLRCTCASRLMVARKRAERSGLFGS
jgi:hypothetical protein